MKQLLEALRHTGPITPQVQGPSDYQRNQQLIEVARIAAYGSTTHLYRLTHMSAANKAIAWKFSKAEVKNCLRIIFEVSPDGQ